MQMFFKSGAWIILVLCLLYQSAAGNGKTEEEVTASPARITLGSLPYGSQDHTPLLRDFTIRGWPGKVSRAGIDLSHASGVKVLSQSKDNDSLVVHLAIDVPEFIRNEPFGVYVKRPIRLETTLPNQPQIIVSVAGWTTVNKTPRNFKDYLFDQNRRWQGSWGTPNMAGCVLAPLAVLLLGVAAALWMSNSPAFYLFKRGLSLIFFALYGLAITFLAFTYSRGAWIALAATLAIMAFSSRRWRGIVLLGSAVFVVIVIFLPAGMKRVESYSRIEGDLSIANRLRLWTGAWQMIADHPITGVGPDQFGHVFEEDYQQFEHTASNSTAVSDYLTFGAERGLFFLSLAVGSLILLLSKSYQSAARLNNGLQLTMASVLLSIMICSAFSTLWFVTEYKYLFFLALVGTTGFLIVQNARRSGWRKQITRVILLEARFVILTLVICGALAAASLLRQPTKSSDITIGTSSHRTLTAHFIQPRWKKPKGLIVYFPGEKGSISLLCHAVLRPLAARGWDIFIADDIIDSDGGKSLLLALQQRAPGEKLFLAGRGEGGRVAWLTASQLSSQIVIAGAGFDFLTTDLDPKHGGETVKQPFLIFHCLYDDRCSANPAICASRRAAFESLPLTVILNPNEAGYFSEDSIDWVKTVDRYFSRQLTGQFGL